jgi:hypothetical protein
MYTKGLLTHHCSCNNNNNNNNNNLFYIAHISIRRMLTALDKNMKKAAVNKNLQRKQTASYLRAACSV